MVKNVHENMHFLELIMNKRRSFISLYYHGQTTEWQGSLVLKVNPTDRSVLSNHVGSFSLFPRFQKKKERKKERKKNKKKRRKRRNPCCQIIGSSAVLALTKQLMRNKR